MIKDSLKWCFAVKSPFNKVLKCKCHSRGKRNVGIFFLTLSQLQENVGPSLPLSLSLYSAHVRLLVTELSLTSTAERIKIFPWPPQHCYHCQYKLHGICWHFILESELLPLYFYKKIKRYIKTLNVKAFPHTQIQRLPLTGFWCRYRSCQ